MEDRWIERWRRDPWHLTARVWAPLIVTLGVLLPYWRIVTMRSFLYSDDLFVSDVFGGELPAHAWMGAAIRAGEAPIWIREAGTGLPVVLMDPVAALLFSLFSPVVALNLRVLLTLLCAALGTFALARRLGGSRAAAIFASMGFAWSGFMVCQLRHLAPSFIASLFPVGLWLLAGALGRSRGLLARAQTLAWLAFVMALQLLAGFPQTTFYCFVVYGAFALAKLGRLLVRKGMARAIGVRLAGLVLFFTTLGIGAGSGVVVALRDVQRESVRLEGASWDWAQAFGMDPWNALSFFVPYVTGDASNGTYHRGGVFWEDYGYAGIFTALLAIFACAPKNRRRTTRFFMVAALVAFYVVMGPKAPGFRFIFEHVPGMNVFRFTQRAMFVIELSLAMLGGFGLDALRRRIKSRRAPAIVAAIVGLSFVDLVWHQLRQNAFADPAAFFAEPDTATFVKKSNARVFTASPRDLHRQAHRDARGWQDLSPYVAIRPMLEPNTNLYWGVSSAGVYAGLPLAKTAQIFGDGANPGAIDDASPQAFRKVLALYDVRWVLSEKPLALAAVRPSLYEIPEALPRAYLARRTRFVDAPIDMVTDMASDAFETGRDVVLLRGEPALDETAGGTATVTVDRSTEVTIETEAPGASVLVLTDAFFSAWVASIDGAPAKILLANHSQRGVVLPPGRHRVEFRLEWAAYRRGLWTSLGFGIALLSIAGGLAFERARRRRR